MAAAVAHATRGIFCGNQPIGRATRGLFCDEGAAPPIDPALFGGGGGPAADRHGNIIRVPLTDIQSHTDDAELAALAIIAIEAYYDE